MAGKLSKFQKQTFNHWMGTTKNNHLGGIFQLQPQKATALMVQLLAWYKGKTLDTFLSQFPTKTFDSDEEYTWDIIGSATRNIPLVEARDADGKVVVAGGDNVGVMVSLSIWYLLRIGLLTRKLLLVSVMRFILSGFLPMVEMKAPIQYIAVS